MNKEKYVSEIVELIEALDEKKLMYLYKLLHNLFGSS